VTRALAGLAIASVLGCSDAPAPSVGSSDETGTSSADTTTSTDTTTTTTTEPPDPYTWPDEDLYPHVDPIIGTGGLGFRVGTVNPGATVPFGMVKPGPDTGLGALQISFVNCTGYHYDQTHIWGFSHSRINGMGVPDYGALLVTPTLGIDEAKLGEGGARSLFDHADEVASAGYYAVTLADTGVRAELTATTRVALHRYTWDAATDDAIVMLDLGYNPADGASPESHVEIDADSTTVRGMTTVLGGYSDRFGGVPTYFVARASRPFATHGVWDDADALLDGAIEQDGAAIGAWLGFELPDGDTTVELAVAISYVSIDQAEANLEAEVLGFDDARVAAEGAWQDELQRIRIAGGDEQTRRMFYTALYHTMLAPTRFDDADGSYRGFDDAIHEAGDSPYYTDFSLWDTYRTLHPLFDLVQRDREGHMMRSLQRMYEQGGDLPKWPLAFGYTGGMVGTPADIVLAAAHERGIAGFDADIAYEGARLHATEDRPADGRVDIAGYGERGWVAADITSSSVSHTLEYAVADASLARWATLLGHADDAAMFSTRARSYENLFAPEHGFLIGRNADGGFDDADFDPTAMTSHFAEGDAWHYLWMVPHDAAGLGELLGGEVVARDRLTGYFEQSVDFLGGADFTANMPVPYYWHSNEPSLHDAYLFTEWGDPASTQRWVEWIRGEHYGDGPNGLPGNDDAGTMSAWYVFSTIGLYPVIGTDRYVLTAPLFERVRLDMSDAQAPDRALEIVAPDAGPGRIHLASATLNGAQLDAPIVTWAQLASGGVLELVVQSEPSDFGAR
jgi:predicted alpha-1,2-mannosidase